MPIRVLAPPVRTAPANGVSSWMEFGFTTSRLRRLTRRHVVHTARVECGLTRDHDTSEYVLIQCEHRSPPSRTDTDMALVAFRYMVDVSKEAWR